MNRSQRAACVLLAGVVVVAAVSTWRRSAGPGPDAFMAESPPAHPSPLPPPSPTPPWMNSHLAVAVADGEGMAVASVDVERRQAPRRLVDGFEAIDALAWAPDGRSLAFAARRDGNWDVFVVAREGGEPLRLTDHPAYDGAPAWAPDGRALAFVSYRDGSLGIYRLPDAAAGGAAEPWIVGDAPSVDPAWSPDGLYLAYAAWRDGAYRLESVPTTGGDPVVVAASDRGADLRFPRWAPGGDALLFLELDHGAGQLRSRAWFADDPTRPDAPTTLASQVAAYDVFPGPGPAAVAVLPADRGPRHLEIRGMPAFAARSAVDVPLDGLRAVAWSAGAQAEGLPSLAASSATTVLAGALPEPRGFGGAPPESPGFGGAPPGSPGFVGLATLDGVDVPGARIHAGLAADFQALRAEVRTAVGRDFLGTLADAWRPLSFSGSAFFSWHKLGRAFDTQMEMRGPGGRRDMVLVRDEADGRTQWRMYLRAGAQDGSIGRPLFEPGWTFAAGSGDPSLAADGGRRAATVPGGYWVDFTALAERHGWRRIPSLRGRLDWRTDWEAIEYWHYERRDGLRWFEAAREVYDHEHLATHLDAERLQALDIGMSRLARLGFPPGWGRDG